MHNILYLKKLKSKTRAVEPVIAALLLIAIAVAASVITYSWVMGMVSTQSEQAGTSIRIDLVEFKAGTDTQTVGSQATLKTDLILGASSTLESGSKIYRGSTVKSGSVIKINAEVTSLASDMTLSAGTISADSVLKAGSVITYSAGVGNPALPASPATLLADTTVTTAITISGSSTIESGSTIKASSSLTLSADYTLGSSEDFTTGTADTTLASGSTLKASSILAASSVVTSDKIEITVRNSGSVDTTISTIYVKTPEGDQWMQTWTSDNVIARSSTKKLTFTTLNPVTGSSGATVSDTSGVPFGWKVSTTYTIKVLTNNGFASESPYSSQATHT